MCCVFYFSFDPAACVSCISVLRESYFSSMMKTSKQDLELQ